MTFSTKSLYRFISDRGVASRVAGYVWKGKIPLKIKFFLWQIFNNKLQVAQSLIKRGSKETANCCLYGLAESVDHIFFQCHIAKFIWSVIAEVFKLQNVPRSLKEFSCTWLQGKGPLPIRLLMFAFAGFVWAMWTIRDKMAIEKKIPKSPADVLYIYVSLMQRWKILLKEIRSLSTYVGCSHGLAQELSA